MQHPESEMAEQIFIATEKLMAEYGLPYLSMQKIAKEANISAGTIYIYFKSKEELLEQFARRVFSSFQREIARNVDESKPFFEQYKQMWLNIWSHLLKNQMMVANIHQYRALPKFNEICQELDNQNLWTSFCNKAKQAEVICDLPADILFSISLESAVKLSFRMLDSRDKNALSDEILDVIIERTWRSIQKEI
ncbi:TetR/AcrR family transcriptional regulator [Lonepinella sp. BR2271]|uniref:TetR/AcrR family transcriptional regulator n=1 Tax=Lonepinella sp. BR2271 TaxID=3434550 RepID=UPI003F6E11E7